LPKVLADALAEAVAELPAGQPYVALSPQRYRGCLRLLSAGRWTEPLSNLPDANFRQPFMRLCRAAGVEHRTFHALRATAITMWLQKGVPVHEVKLLAGHADVETTMRYYAGGPQRPLPAGGIGDRRNQELSIGATGLEPATS
jgi:integrase